MTTTVYQDTYHITEKCIVAGLMINNINWSKSAEKALLLDLAKTKSFMDQEPQQAFAAFVQATDVLINILFLIILLLPKEMVKGL